MAAADEQFSSGSRIQSILIILYGYYMHILKQEQKVKWPIKLLPMVLVAIKASLLASY